jgi:hypothetical protein
VGWFGLSVRKKSMTPARPSETTPLIATKLARSDRQEFF